MNLKTLLSKNKPPAQEIRDAIAELQARESEIERRIADIAPGSAITTIGATRKRVELEGSPADLVALDQELAMLKAERSALPTKREALAERLREAEADAAARSLPGKIKALDAVLARYTEAKAAAAKAEAALRDAGTEIGQQRRALEDAGRQAPGVSYEAAAAIATALGHEKPEAAGHYSMARAGLFKRLGAEQVEMQAAEAAAAARTAGDKFAKEDGDNVDERRHPEASIWRRKAL